MPSSARTAARARRGAAAAGAATGASRASRGAERAGPVDEVLRGAERDAGRPGRRRVRPGATPARAGRWRGRRCARSRSAAGVGRASAATSPARRPWACTTSIGPVSTRRSAPIARPSLGRRVGRDLDRDEPDVGPRPGESELLLGRGRPADGDRGAGRGEPADQGGDVLADAAGAGGEHDADRPGPCRVAVTGHRSPPSPARLPGVAGGRRPRSPAVRRGGREDRPPRGRPRPRRLPQACPVRGRRSSSGCRR